ncbi:MAG: TRAP transporter large permease subunit [Deltaproteobacteria bacterium]|nr:TRAP transporter large permease subunit [Deltaproteobacteria bacterium]
MSPEVFAVTMFCTLIVCIIFGHPLAYTLMFISALFGLISNGFNIPAQFDIFANICWGLINNYTLVAIPLFIYMAQVLDRSGVAEELFDSMYIVLGGIKGGLGLAVVVVCTVFAASTGIIGASVVAMTLLASPAMLNKGYQKELTAGVICAAGTLGILIPPSIMMVVYGGLTGMKETSVGMLFAGGIMPGLLLAGLYFAYIIIRCNLDPELGPPVSKEEASAYTASQKWGMTLKSLIPPLSLILIVMGSILGGIATPTEAAGMGALGSVLLALVKRKITWEVVKTSGYQTLKVTSMVMMLFIGGKFFASVFLGAGGGDVVSNLLVGSGIDKWVALLIMMVIVFIMGAFVDWAAILLVTVPIFLPIALELGFDPLWFSLLMCVNLQTSFLTPPFGYALFYFKGAAPEGYTMMDIYRGIIPFVILQIIGLFLITVFPKIVTWLPTIVFGAY